MHGQIQKYKILSTFISTIYYKCGIRRSIGLTYKNIFFQILCFTIVKYVDIDIEILCLMGDIEIHRWCVGFRRSTARLWLVPCWDTSGFSPCLNWSKTRLWQVSLKGRCLEWCWNDTGDWDLTCNDWDTVGLIIRCFTTNSLQSIISGTTQRHGKSFWLWWRSTDSNLPFLKTRVNLWTKKTTFQLGLSWRSKTFLSDPGVPGVRSMGPDVTHSLTDYLQTELMRLWLMMSATQYQLMMSIRQS